MSQKDDRPGQDLPNGQTNERDKTNNKSKANTAYNTPADDRRPLAGRIMLGLILILLGVVFLIGNLTPNMSFSKLWPIFIIAWGFAGFISGLIPPIRFSRVTHGLLVITIGTILLCNTLGFFPFSFWFDLLSLWPVLLIVAGIAILGEVLGNKTISALPSIILIATISVAFFYHGIVFKNSKVEEANSFSFSKSFDSSVSKGVAELQFPLGRLRVGATDKLYSVEGKGRKGNLSPRVEFDRSGSSIRLAIMPETGFSVFYLGRDKGWNVGLSRNVEWTINVDAGVSDANIDLSEIKVRNLDLSGGINGATVRLGDKIEHASVMIDTGVSDMRILVPKSSGLRFAIDDGLSNKNFRNIILNPVREDGQQVFETPGYNEASERIDLEVDAGVSNLTIEGY